MMFGNKEFINILNKSGYKYSEGQDIHLPELLVIPGTVKTIEPGTFDSCPKVKEIILEEGVEVIKEDAFAQNNFLEKVTIPSTVQKIQTGAFRNCSKLKEVTLVNGLEELDDNAFADCYSLEKITIPDTVKRIGIAAFKNCEQLQEVDMGTSVEKIESDAFIRCFSLEKISLPKSVKTIGWLAFYECPKAEITVKSDNIKLCNDLQMRYPNIKVINSKEEFPKVKKLNIKK